MKTIISADVDKFASLQIDLLQKYKAGHITTGHIEWFNNLSKDERDALLMADKNHEILRLLSGCESLIIDAHGGIETFASANEVFKFGIYPPLEDWSMDRPEELTGETAVVVYEVVRDANFVKMFDSLVVDFDKMCFTKHQIKIFCRKYPNCLRTDGYATFFPLKMKEQFFVASVLVYREGLGIFLYDSKYSSVWPSKHKYRVIVPQF